MEAFYRKRENAATENKFESKSGASDDVNKVDRAKLWGIALAIGIVYAMFVNYGVRTFYPDKCLDCNNLNQYRDTNQADCEKHDGTWYSDNSIKGAPGAAVTGSCDYYANCQTKCTEDMKPTKQAIFAILLVSGIGAIIAGVAGKVMAPVSLGLILGGMFNILSAMFGYWDQFNNGAKFALLGFGLAALVYVGNKAPK